MKRILPLLFLLPTLCYAQDYYVPPVSHQPRHYNNTLADTFKTHAWFFSFTIGLSVPLRDYASKDTAHNFMIVYARNPYIYNPDTIHGKGFANLGFHVNVNGGIFLSPNLGIAGKIAYNQNSFDENTLNLLVNGNYYYNLNSSFSIWQFMVGPFANFQIDKNSSVWLQAMAGLVNADFPAFALVYTPLTLNISLPNSNTLAGSLSVGYEKAISQNVGFITTLAYTATRLIYPSVSYNATYSVPGAPSNTYVQQTPVTMSFGSLDFSLGLLFHL